MSPAPLRVQARRDLGNVEVPAVARGGSALFASGFILRRNRGV